MTAEESIVYLDNAATTFPKPEAVYSSMDSFYRHFGGNAGRGANPLARKAASLIDDTRLMLCTWLNAPSVVFAPSATIALNTIIMGARLRAGDVVYVTPFEHNSILRPLEYLRQTVGIQVHVLPFDKNTLECKLENVKKLFRLDPPKLICMTQISNVLGLVIPVDELALMAKQIAPNCITLIDGAQAAGLYHLDMSNIDAQVWSGHKSLYGPYGIAGIAFGTNWRPDLLIRGGTGTVSESIDMPEDGPSRFEAGSHNISAVAGLNAALKWMNEIGYDTINNHTRSLTEHLYNMLLDLPNVTTYLPDNRNMLAGIVSFSVEGVKPQIIETLLGAENVAIRAGLHCSPWAHDFIGSIQYGGTVRVSLGYYNSSSEITSFLTKIARIVKLNSVE